MANIEDTLAHMGEDDRERFIESVGKIGAAFAAKTGIEADPTTIANLPSVRDHVLTGGEYPLDLAASIDALCENTEISNKLVAAEVEKAEVSKITTEIANMSPQQKINYARERGLDHPRDDTSTSNMTRNEHDAVLLSLSPQQRINYARRHGLV